MPNIPQHVSEAQITRFKNREGYTAVCQRLRGDRPGVFTYGYGQTGCKPDAYISEPDADKLLREKVTTFEDGVRHLVLVDLTQDQFDALVDFSYNVGLGKAGFGGSTLLKKLNAGDYEGADEEFQKWVMADGRVLQGLVARRTEEAEEFKVGIDAMDESEDENDA